MERDVLTNIRDIRKKRKMSQQEVSEKVPCHQSYYSRIERGKVNVTVDELLKIAKILRATITIKG